MQKTKHNFFGIFLFFLVFSFTACTTTGIIKPDPVLEPVLLPKNELFPQQLIWNTVEPGVEVQDYKIESIGVTWSCVKIDLDRGFKLYEEPLSNGLVKCFSMKKFSKKYNTISAINTAPFDLGKTNAPIGIIKYKNEVIFPAVENYAAACFYTNENNKLRAAIIPHQTEEALENFEYAVGAFYQVLDNGKVIKFRRNRRSRAGLGISDNGRFVYLFAVTPVFSLTDRNGLNYEECALILKWLGCSDALQFDGGHSTGLTVKEKHLEQPFMQRKVPAALGFSIK